MVITRCLKKNWKYMEFPDVHIMSYSYKQQNWYDANTICVYINFSYISVLKNKVKQSNHLRMPVKIYQI